MYIKILHHARIICLSPLFLTLSFFGFILFSFTPIFDTNDDVSMLRMASGYFDGTPSPLLVYIHPFYGIALSNLYISFPDIPWYGIFFLCILFISLSCIIRLLFILVKERNVIILSLCFILPFFIYATLFIQYTVVASIVTLAGLLTLYHELQTPRQRKTLLALGMFLVFLGYLIREHAMFYTSLLSLPLCVIVYQSLQNVSKKRIAFLCFGIIVLLVAISSLIRPTFYSQSPEWRTFKQWSDAQTFYWAYDINGYEKNKKIYTDLGLSRNDFAMLNTWFYEDEQVFSVQKITSIVQYAKKNNFSTSGIVSALKMTAYQLWEYAFFILPFLLFLGVIFFNMRRSRVAYLSILSLLFLGLCLVIYFSFLGRALPRRFFLPFVLSISLFTLFICARNIQKKKMSFSFLSILLTCALYSVAFSVNLLTTAYHNKESVVQFSHILREIPNDSLIFNWASTLPMQWIGVFDSLKKFEKKDIAGTGWPQRSPYEKNLFRKYHIQNIYIDMIDNPRVFLIAPPDYLSLLSIYMQEHYKKNIHIITVKEFTIQPHINALPYTAQLVQIKSENY